MANVFGTNVFGQFPKHSPLPTPASDLGQPAGQRRPKCYVCGCVLNCAPYLPSVFKNIKTLSQCFDECTILIFYDRSTDNSLEILTDAKNTAGFKMEILLNDTEMSEVRTTNIMNARNSIMAHIKGAADPSYEYFIMMDMDDVSCRLAPQAPLILQRFLANHREWDCLSFHRKDYYDIWALSVAPYSVSCWNFLDTSTNSRRSAVLEIQDYIAARLNSLPPNTLIACQSAFNGFAIYKKEMFINCTYNNRIDDNVRMVGGQAAIDRQELAQRKIFINTDGYDCEHRHFHFQSILQNKSRIRISSAIVFDEFNADPRRI